jgi:hypothetical protein
LGSYSELDFKRWLRVNVFTFKYLCILLGLLFKKEDTKMRASILVECRIVVVFFRLGTGNTLMMVVGDLFWLGLSTTSKIVRE